MSSHRGKMQHRKRQPVQGKLSGAPAATPKDSSSLPSEEEFNRTLSYTERLLRGIMKTLREEAPDNKP
jgi:hypothetical protein